MVFKQNDENICFVMCIRSERWTMDLAANGIAVAAVWDIFNCRIIRQKLFFSHAICGAFEMAKATPMLHYAVGNWHKAVRLASRSNICAHSIFLVLSN